MPHPGPRNRRFQLYRQVRRPASLEKGVAVRTLIRNPGQENPFAVGVMAVPWTSRTRRGCAGVNGAEKLGHWGGVNVYH